MTEEEELIEQAVQSRRKTEELREESGLGSEDHDSTDAASDDEAEDRS